VAEVRLEVEAGVASLVLDAPGRRNAFTVAMAEELVEACEAIDADSSVGAVVVSGAGGAFCAGADRETLLGTSADPAAEEAYERIGWMYRSFVRVGELDPPTIAAVRGPAVGAGLNLALATDLRVVAEDARLVSGFARLGIHPGGGHFVLAGRTAGREAAVAVGLFGEELSGARAAELGMAWAAVPDAEVEPLAHRLAARAGADPELARRTAASLRLELGPPALSWPAGVEAERATQMWSLRRLAERR
jgi:enoyl-CoA hydratase